jgi:hypothetical protein
MGALCRGALCRGWKNLLRGVILVNINNDPPPVNLPREIMTLF